MRTLPILLGLVLLSSPLLAQDRDTKVRNDRKAFGASKDWIYNDLGEGVRAAKEAGKPLLVVFRCIPCEACQEFDDDVARRDPIIRDLLDEFVCVRIVQANTIDLTTLPARLRPVLRRLPDEPGPDHLRAVRHPLRAGRSTRTSRWRGSARRWRRPCGCTGTTGRSSRPWRASRSSRPATRRPGTTRASRASTARRSTTRARRRRAACTATRSGRPSGWSTARRGSRSPTRCSSRTPTRPCWA